MCIGAFVEKVEFRNYGGKKCQKKFIMGVIERKITSAQ